MGARQAFGLRRGCQKITLGRYEARSISVRTLETRKRETMMKNKACEREFDFALVLTGISELTRDVEDSLFEAGCDDATLSMQYGATYLTFSRAAASLKDAIFSAIRDVRKAGFGVHSIDYCDLVSQSDIARRLDRTRQLVHQYITGERGPGGFPPPDCHIADNAPLWNWCEVAEWLRENDMIRAEVLQEAWEAAVINSVLEQQRQKHFAPEITEEVFKFMSSVHPQFLPPPPE